MESDFTKVLLKQQLQKSAQNACEKRSNKNMRLIKTSKEQESGQRALSPELAIIIDTLKTEELSEFAATEIELVNTGEMEKQFATSSFAQGTVRDKHQNSSLMSPVVLQHYMFSLKLNSCTMRRLPLLLFLSLVQQKVQR